MPDAADLLDARPPDMLFLGRLLLVAAFIAGLGYGALYAITRLVEPEQREVSIIIPTPKPKP